MRFIVVLILVCMASAQARSPDGGGALSGDQFADELPLVQRGAIEQRLRSTQQRLHSAGLLAPASTSTLQLQWPLQVQPGYPYFGYFGISNFVDHDATFPDHVQDYTCGDRTYDTAQGYNHAGTDYFLWPAPWQTMDAKQVAIVAAAAGTIVGRSDQNFDRSCAMGNSEWNAVYVRHDDGTVAWYGHMKSGTPTPKQIGERVEAGEFLGFVGSSGSSTGPHLHFELHDATGHVIDPRHGACSAGPDYWAVPQPYEDPRISSLTILTDEPNMIACGVDGSGKAVDEHLQETNVLAPGQILYAMVTFRDQRSGQPSSIRIRQPDGSVFAQWTFDLGDGDLPDAFYPATYWYWRYTLPANAQSGAWSLEASYQNQNYATQFLVGDAESLRRSRVFREREDAARVDRHP